MSDIDPTDEDLLTPGQASPLEEEIARLAKTIETIDPSVIETIWDAWACPAALLPWLAWSVSVDNWDDGWTEVVKRQAIADSPYLHRIKGTRLAVDKALELLQRPVTVTEWWEISPARRRGTAAIFVRQEPEDDVNALKARALRLARGAKPKSRHVAISAGLEAIGPANVGCVLHTSSIVTLMPPNPVFPEVSAAIRVAAALSSSSLVTLSPRPRP